MISRKHKWLDTSEHVTHELTKTESRLKNLYRFKSDRSLRTERVKGDADTKFHPQPPSKGRSAFSVQCLWVLSTTFQGGSHAQTELANTK